MRMSSFSPASIVGAIEGRLRLAREARRLALLRRELSRLPRYVARDIGAAPDQDRFVNFSD